MRDRRRFVAVPAGTLLILSLSGMTPSAPHLPTPIQHVLMMYQENHSFDNMLGRWCAKTGRCNGIPARVTLRGGVVVTPTQAPDAVPYVAHSVIAQQTAIDGGAMDGWAGVGGCGPPQYACISYYTPAQLPNLTALASNFALSDATFSMADSPSWGGHLYAVAASLDGFTGNNPRAAAGVSPGLGWGCDSKKVSGWVSSSGKRPLVPSCVPDPSLGRPNGGAFQPTPVAYIPTIMDRIDARPSLSWRMYTTPASTDFSYSWATCPSFAECLYGPQHRNMVATDQILSDARNGTLPNFGLILPGPSSDPLSGGSSQHDGSMIRGDNWIGTVVTALEASPQWDSTALFITYDDCGCFYDHVAPSINPDGSQQGPRMPMVMISPYARAGFTDHRRASIASILAYVEYTFGLRPLSANDSAAYNYSAAFDYSQSPRAGIHMIQSHIPAGQRPSSVGDDPT